jgi:hypothetical protein
LLAFEISAAYQARDVAVAGLRLAQECDFRGRRALAALFYEQIYTDDGFHALCECGAIELHHRKEVALVGYGDGGHAGGAHRIDELGHAYHAVNQRVLGVQA